MIPENTPKIERKIKIIKQVLEVSVTITHIYYQYAAAYKLSAAG